MILIIVWEVPRSSICNALSSVVGSHVHFAINISQNVRLKVHGSESFDARSFFCDCWTSDFSFLCDVMLPDVSLIDWFVGVDRNRNQQTQLPETAVWCLYNVGLTRCAVDLQCVWSCRSGRKQKPRNSADGFQRQWTLNIFIQAYQIDFTGEIVE